jgi:predicted Zn-dependent protease
MLFDLRSRGRRRTVQAVYLGLALLMGGGLVLFGVGTGSGGGILDAFTGGGSSGAAKQAVSQQEKAALKATSLRPNDPQAWASVVQARYQSAGQGSDYNPNTGTYTAAGIKELRAATQAWQRYEQLTPHPSPDLALLAARAYDATGDYANEARTWELVTAANPTTATYYEYLAVAAYKAKEIRKGDLAAAKAVSLTPKLQQSQLQQQLKQLKSSLVTSTTQTSTVPGK